MSLETGLVAFLKADSAIAAIVGARIYHELRPQNDPLPALLWQIISEPEELLTDGKANLPQTRVQLDCYAETSAAVFALQEAVDAALDGHTGDMGGQQILLATRDNRTTLSEQTGDKVVRRVSLDYVITWNT